MLKTILPLALLLTAGAPALAKANDFGTAAVRVSYADINLGTAAGAAELDRRIERAVRTVCPGPADHGLAIAQAVAACRAAARTSVAEQRQQAVAARTGTITVAAGR